MKINTPSTRLWTRGRVSVVEIIILAKAPKPRSFTLRAPGNIGDDEYGKPCSIGVLFLGLQHVVDTCQHVSTYGNLVFNIESCGVWV